MCLEVSTPVYLGLFLISSVASWILISWILLVLGFVLILWFRDPSWFKTAFAGRARARNENEGDDDGNATEVLEDKLSLPWTELLPHVKLEEYLKLEGSTPEGYSFWLILRPGSDHTLYLTAYDVTGTIQRTPAGESGLAKIRPREAMVLYSRMDDHDQLNHYLSVTSQEDDWPSDVACAILLANRVDYCQGNDLVCRARTQRLNCKFIKAWDLPTEYALRAAQSSMSMLSKFALQLVEAKSLEATLPGPLASDKVYVLGDAWGNTMRFTLEDRHGLRIFRSREPGSSGEHSVKDIERDLKKQDLVHLRLAPKTSQEPGEGQDGDPIILYREVEESGIRSQNLSQVNVVVGVTNPDGSVTDCLRIQQAETHDGAQFGGNIKVEFIAGGKGFGAAVWKQSFHVPDHQLIKTIGGGAYGQVWLARNAVGSFHAVKILQRSTFADEHPYEREFQGIQRFMPISRQHPGLVNILHVGRNDDGGFMYCVMEAADDQSTGQRIDPQHYVPRSLAGDLALKGPLSISEAVQLGIDLCDALGFVHDHGLIHRDIKPANIIFVNGRPKLADIGLVTEMAREASEVTSIGTAGYFAPEGPGTAAADVYSLGMVLYVACTNCKATQFPDLPESLGARPDVVDLIHLNNIILKACEPEVQLRYPSAKALREQLHSLQEKLGKTLAQAS
ncbi:MAG TPA: serine/threonine-protein kinase [Candidatus Paceibacterota bacterium]|nr:serine/threonine-protein kinase [Verrucomicrobiota bacterium]HRY47164.1 serine/threonine-protein kinase [Candidatus Paceibacterota bacterium]